MAEVKKQGGNCLQYNDAERDSFHQGAAPSNRHQQRSSAPHLIIRIIRHIKKSRCPNGHLDFGTPKGTRTPDLLIRSQSLYPTELSAHVRSTRLAIIAYDFKKCKHYFAFFSKIFKNGVLFKSVTTPPPLLWTKRAKTPPPHGEMAVKMLIQFSMQPQDPSSLHYGKESYLQSKSRPH